MVSQHLPLTPAVLHILLALADQKRHGYGIMKEVERQTDGQTQMGPGTLYGSIKRMRKAGFIEELDELSAPDLDSRKRRYYQLTDLGRRILQAETARLASLVRIAQVKAVVV